eukprot:PhF_6_TR28139/c0_g1_i4/m.41671
MCATPPEKSKRIEDSRNAVVLSTPPCRAGRSLQSWGCADCTSEHCSPPVIQPDEGGDASSSTLCPSLQEVYAEMLQYPSDINRLLPILQLYAHQSNAVVEMGSRRGHSTTAFFLTFPKNFTLIDLELTEDVRALAGAYDDCRPKDTTHFHMVESDDLKTHILDDTDMLFIDTLHSGPLLRKELAKHSRNVRKWILFHDVISFGDRDEADPAGQRGGYGLRPVIKDFLKESNGEWREEAYFPFSNGLLVLRRAN